MEPYGTLWNLMEPYGTGGWRIQHPALIVSGCSILSSRCYCHARCNALWVDPRRSITLDDLNASLICG